MSGLPFEYNLDGNKGCLIGNWDEERKLQNTAGDARCTWVAGAGGRLRPDQTKTGDRVLGDRAADTASWKSAGHASFMDPKHKTASLQYVPDHRLGARERALAAALYAEASRKEEEYEEPSSLDTTYSRTYQDPGRNDRVGQRISRSLDYEATSRDVTFGREHGLIPAHTTDVKHDPEEVYVGPLEPPITVWSEGGQNTFSMSDKHLSRTAPMGRYTAFSQPIEEYTRKESKIE